MTTQHIALFRVVSRDTFRVRVQHVLSDEEFTLTFKAWRLVMETNVVPRPADTFQADMDRVRENAE